MPNPEPPRQPRPKRIDASELARWAHQLVDLQRAAYRVEAALIGDGRIPQLTESVEELLAQDLIWHVVLDGNRPVAAVAYRCDGAALDIDRLVVEPSHHRQGLARQLLGSIPGGPATVSTGRDNPPARRLYEGLGFRHTGDREVLPGLWLSSYARP